MSSNSPHLAGSTTGSLPFSFGLKASVSAWRGDPIPISVPSNDHRNIHIQEPAPTWTRSKNPLDRPLGRQKRQIGNTTSRSTLVQTGSSMTSGRSPKRQRLDIPSANSKDSPFVVFDDDDVGSDELNLRSVTQHQPFSKRFTLAADGATYTEIASVFSDPIEEFPPETSHERGGFVSEKVHHFENKNTPPRIDFTTLKRGMKGKSKGNGILKPRTQNAQLDQPDKIPVHSCFVDAQLWASTPQQQLWMYTRNKVLVIEDNSRKAVNKPVLDACSMLFAKPCGVDLSPVLIIQFAFKSINPEKTTITIQLDTKHPQWNLGAYITFVETLEKTGLDNQFLRSKQTARLWEMAEQNANLQGNETHNTVLEDLRDLQSKPRQKHMNASHPKSATTSLKRKADLDPPDARAASPSHTLGFNAGSSRSKSNALPTERNLRSRNKVTLDIEPVQSSLTNPDEVVLCYPAGLPGAVSITNVDLERLNPGAFLNDTLIEFGLKVWLRDLESSNPELADQIHVFSSFFYKKLNSKKDLQVAYESVRKWTNKFDIFRKKYIIVPINEHLHWYLAIIYEPEHVLKDPPVVNQKSPPRPQTRQFTAQAISEIDSNSSRIDQRLDTQMENLDQHSEVEVERDLEDFQNYCSIDDRVPPQPDSDGDIYEALSRSADDVMASPNHRDLSMTSEATHQPSNWTVAPPKGRRPLGAVDPGRFYQSPGAQRRYGTKKRVQGGTKSPEMCVDPDERDKIEIVDNAPKTYIFTFDSLGARHPQALKRLSSYLKMEAKYKKGVNDAGISMIEGKNALVPCQTNFCDCGIYLLHFAQTFMSDPRKYANIILAPRLKSTGDTERKAIWLVDKDFEPDGRQKLRLRIETLSKEWKELRDDAEKQSEEVMNGNDESDGEVELVESDTRKHPKASRKSQSQGQKTGPASRVRG